MTRNAWQGAEKGIRILNNIVLRVGVVGKYSGVFKNCYGEGSRG